MILKINPRDVVSIPSDYNDAKGRACKYEVISELAVAPQDAFDKPVQVTAVGSVAPEVNRGPVVAAATTQDYDKNGNSLSMTPNAIRKRAQRAAKRAAAGSGAMKQQWKPWPLPKV